MTKKHFIAIAETFAATKPLETSSDAALTQWALDVEAMASVCTEFNKKFDRVRFLTACGLKGGHY
jgi:hypothetical protein